MGPIGITACGLRKGTHFSSKKKKTTQEPYIEPTCWSREEGLEAYFVLAFIEFVGLAVFDRTSKHLTEDGKPFGEATVVK